MNYKKISELTTVVTGGTPSTSVAEYWDNGTIPWLQSGCCQNCDVDSTEKYITQAGYDNSSTRIMPKDTVMIALTGATAGKIGYLTFEACGNQSITGILPCEFLNQRFLYYYLISQRSQILADCVGGAQTHISQGYVKNIEIPLYSLEKQKQIVEVLDKICSVLTDREQELQKLDELVKARFVEMFGDVRTGVYKFETRKLGDVAEVGSSHRVFTTEFVETGIPFYRGTEIGELASGIKPENPYRITEEHYNRLACDETKPKIGDLLMPSICNKGQVWMVDTEEPFYYKDGRVLCVSPNRELFNCKFLEQFMREKTLVEYPKLGSGSTFAEFKIFLLKDIDVIIPPIELQNQFAEFCKQLDKSKVVVQKELENAQELFDSLMQQYFG